MNFTLTQVMNTRTWLSKKAEDRCNWNSKEKHRLTGLLNFISIKQGNSLQKSWRINTSIVVSSLHSLLYISRMHQHQRLFGFPSILSSCCGMLTPQVLGRLYSCWEYCSSWAAFSLSCRCFWGWFSCFSGFIGMESDDFLRLFWFSILATGYGLRIRTLIEISNMEKGMKWERISPSTKC